MSSSAIQDAKIFSDLQGVTIDRPRIFQSISNIKAEYARFKEASITRIKIEPIGTHVIPKGSTTESLIYDGNFDTVLSDAQRFKVGNFGPRELYLGCFWVNMGWENLHRELSELRNLKVAGYEDLLIFGQNKHFWDLQKELPVISYGTSTIIKNQRVCPCIMGRGARNLEVRPYEKDLGAICQILLTEA